MDDNTVLKFGKYKDEKLANVPAWWLIWYYEENAPLMNYIREHRAQLEKEKAKDNGR